jgi:hypothetical protein
MKMDGTCSNRAHKSGSHVVSTLRKVSKSFTDLQFHEPLFETLYLPIWTESAQATIDKVEVHM